jgi:hypothetical protein
VRGRPILRRSVRKAFCSFGYGRKRFVSRSLIGVCFGDAPAVAYCRFLRVLHNFEVARPVPERNMVCAVCPSSSCVFQGVNIGVSKYERKCIGLKGGCSETEIAANAPASAFPPHRAAWSCPLARRCSPTQRSVETSLFAWRWNYRFRPSRVCQEAETMFVVSPASRSIPGFLSSQGCSPVSTEPERASATIARGRL